MDIPNGKKERNTLFRVAFTGPECSGKTTMSRWCAESFNLPWVPEQARSYLADKQEYGRHDVLKIGALQFTENHAHERVVCDTELTVIRIWEKEKYGDISSQISLLSQQEVYTLLFLCAPDIPWKFDPLRENPLDRDRLFQCYHDDLVHRGISFTILSGPLAQRERTIQEHFNKHLIFAPK